MFPTVVAPDSLGEWSLMGKPETRGLSYPQVRNDDLTFINTKQGRKHK
jgi:hypothetical protein